MLQFYKENPNFLCKLHTRGVFSLHARRVFLDHQKSTICRIGSHEVCFPYHQKSLLYRTTSRAACFSWSAETWQLPPMLSFLSFYRTKPHKQWVFRCTIKWTLSFFIVHEVCLSRSPLCDIERTGTRLRRSRGRACVNHNGSRGIKRCRRDGHWPSADWRVL